MSLIMGKHRQSRAIKRIKIRQRLLTNPQEQTQKQKSIFALFETVKHGEVDDEQKTSPSRMMAQTKGDCFYTQKLTTYQSKNSNRSQAMNNQKDVVVKQFTLSKGKKEGSLSSIVEKNNMKINMNLNKQKIQAQPVNNMEKNQDRNRSLHMNYREYEQLIKKSEISPSYFQNIAKKNDENLAIKDKSSQKVQLSVKDLQKNRNQNHFRSQVKDKLPTLNRSKRAKTMRSETESHQFMKTILGCNLGALSTTQIKQKLEQKWINEQKENMTKNNTLVFTQESQIVSQIDTKYQTNRQQFFVKEERRKSKKTPKGQQKINWNMIPNEKFKAALQNILELKQNGSIVKAGQKQYSLGSEYMLRQERMLQPFSLYKPKKYIMKHKLEWKV